MTVPRKLLAMAAGAVLALSASAISQSQAQQPAPGRNPGDTMLIDDATFEFIQKSDVSALSEGVLDKLELKIGMTVQKGGEIGSLHKRKAQLLVKKAETAANATGAIAKAEAQISLAESVVARNDSLLKKNAMFVSREDIDKAVAELKMGLAMSQEATENQKLAKDELELAKNALEEHTIRAPFGGVILKLLKKVGESVKANEPVVELGSLDKLRVFAYVPLETSLRLSEGSEVEFQLRIRGDRGAQLPIEQKRFRGAISFIDPQIQPEVKTEVRIYADFNNDSYELKPGMKGELTLFLNPPGAKPIRRTAPPAAEASAPAVAPTLATAPARDAVVPTSAPESTLPPLPRN